MKSKIDTDRPTLAGGPSLLGPLICCALAFGLAPADEAGATPGSRVTPRSVAIGALPETIRAKFKAAHGQEARTRRDWRVLLDTGEVQPIHDESGTDVDDIVMVEFTIAPGGYFGWHRHSGPVWVVVKEGTLTLYDGHDATCTGRAYVTGSAFLDAGRDVHNARNEGNAPVVVYATFMLPDGGPLRVDAPNPGVCPF